MLGKEDKGITMIMLVVMIVILIILAGVTISAVIGDNGIIDSAQEAKDNTDERKISEKINLAIRDSIGIDGVLNNEDIKDNLNKIENIEGVPEEVIDSSYPLKVTVDEKYSYTINKDGTIGEKQETEEPPTVITTEIEIGDYIQYDVS